MTLKLKVLQGMSPLGVFDTHGAFKIEYVDPLWSISLTPTGHLIDSDGAFKIEYVNPLQGI